MKTDKTLTKSAIDRQNILNNSDALPRIQQALEEAIGYHVAAGHIDRDLLTDVIRSIIKNEDYSESTKLELLHAMSMEIGFSDD